MKNFLIHATVCFLFFRHFAQEFFKKFYKSER